MSPETGVQPEMATFAIGVDLGGTNLRIAAVDVNGNILEKITTGTEVARGRDQVIFEMSEAVRELTSTHQVLLFTCHPHLVEIAREIVPTAKVFPLQ